MAAWLTLLAVADEPADIDALFADTREDGGILTGPIVVQPPATLPARSHAEAVITHLPLRDNELGVDRKLELVSQFDRCLETAAWFAGGEHDGSSLSPRDAVFYTYGADADRLLGAIEQCLADFPLPADAYAVKRYGPADDPNAREERVPLP